MEYIILSLKHSEGNEPTFWRSNNAGYVNSPFKAGVYSQTQIDNQPGYYDNGTSTLAIELSERGLDSIGFKATIDIKKVLQLAKTKENERQK